MGTGKKELPDWIKIDYRHNNNVLELKREFRKRGLHTVCEEARCPNLAECFGIRKTATFMILGDTCTRNCAFCNVKHGVPVPADKNEPSRIAEMTKRLELAHVVITSVTRDDLPDGGSGHYSEVIRSVRHHTGASVEVLTPDFRGSEVQRRTVSAEKPEIYNHNVETVPELYGKVRPGADFERSVELLKGVKTDEPSILTKSGIMAGLGETDDQLKYLLEVLAGAGIDIFTCGQYLRPSRSNIEVFEYRTEEWFDRFRETALSFGIPYVYSSPFTRSSYNASEIITGIKRNA